MGIINTDDDLTSLLVGGVYSALSILPHTPSPSPTTRSYEYTVACMKEKSNSLKFRVQNLHTGLTSLTTICWIPEYFSLPKVDIFPQPFSIDTIFIFLWGKITLKLYGYSSWNLKL